MRDRIRREIVRLGGGLRLNGDMSRPAMARALGLFDEFASSMRQWGTERAWAVGTSALREAPSAGVFLDSARKTLGFELEVINGDEEARLTSVGVQAGVGRINDGVILDIGGGSTEFARLEGGREAGRTSIPEGVVHLTERFLHSDPPSGQELLAIRESVRELMADLPLGGTTLVATAGTPTTLAALDLAIDEYDPTLVNGHVLSRERVSGLVQKLCSLTSSQRLALPGMERGREDLIVAGAIIIDELMDRWQYDELLVSDWGLLEGIAIECAVAGRGYEIGKGA
ncbi:MAG: exopolyphosphatase [bacterium]|nr:MAG: exopolyphosphatase [bacterium]